METNVSHPISRLPFVIWSERVMCCECHAGERMSCIMTSLPEALENVTSPPTQTHTHTYAPLTKPLWTVCSSKKKKTQQSSSPSETENKSHVAVITSMPACNFNSSPWRDGAFFLLIGASVLEDKYIFI